MAKTSQSDLINRLRLMVDDLIVGPEILSLLIPEGKPHDAEKQLWDYKEQLPFLPEKVTDDDRKAFNAELGDLIKDAISFHNAYGGYILFGVADKGKSRVKGIEGRFDCTDFNKRLNAYIGDNPIECDFQRLAIEADGVTREIGALLIPRRAPNAVPVSFLKDGPVKSNGGKCFNKGIYVRIRDECRPAASTNSDWTFLHSDRSPTHRTSAKRDKLPSTLPARDPDLIEFLGRDQPLARLREWITDPRRPVELITGIGGLGKTTLAYRFAEEVSELGAGGLEQVIWLAAKVRTYSALKGEMVAVGRVDFDDIFSLHRAILSALRYDVGPDEEDFEQQDFEERIIEALTIVPALIVVDDIDSLDPEEQRNVVASMNSIGLRTVGRELPSSKILMTSRIDQGIPQTAVLKLEGLERPAFSEFLKNIATAFGIPIVYGEVTEKLYESSSGSPLFAASILRLVKLGENILHALETWKGQDGEDVRAFAFEREIQRLSNAEGRLLLAVMLLGETSIQDLAAVLDITPKMVRERIGQLQSYHLLATSVRGSADTIIYVPSDLLAVKEILKRHLGTQAQSVEEACARAEQESRNNTKAIGLAIRSILGLWKDGRADEAVIAAKKLQSQHPTNGDVACIYGASLIKVKPPRSKEADIAFEDARRQNCSRVELPAYIIQTKKDLEDWQGLYLLTKALSSNEVHRDIWLDAFLIACNGLIGTARIRGDLKRIFQLSFEVVERITGKLHRQKVTSSYFQHLIGQRFNFGRIYFETIAQNSNNNGDQIALFDATIRLAENEIFLSDLLKRGVKALDVWWGSVEARKGIDEAARALLSRQVRRLNNLEKQISRIGKVNPEVRDVIQDVSHDLAFRGARYGHAS
ncbi:RNA-binding domain-containing protein [Rhizobium leguminosarum]|uniref:RNA-binding domain-containing protein n=1 Tax=Rhizobium leguminosarum TaxID=384 RepID=UPI00036E7AA4|nr:RNA-binding domain-containing protein [Rhizobium leguminosarum]